MNRLFVASYHVCPCLVLEVYNIFFFRIQCEAASKMNIDRSFFKYALVFICKLTKCKNNFFVSRKNNVAIISMGCKIYYVVVIV